MALDIKRVILDASESSILSVAFNPHKRELYAGCGDGKIKVWSSETGEYIRTLQEHSGWVTGMLYSSEARLFFTASVDGKIKMWNNKGEVLHTEKAFTPIYCLAWEPRKRMLMAGTNECVRFYHVPEDPSLIVKANITAATIKLVCVVNSHKDLIKNIVCSERGKLYSGGFDGSICMYDVENPRKFQSFPSSHYNAISVMAYDVANNWIVTGSYDATVKIWSQDIKPLQTFDGFSGAVTGLCYCASTRTLLVAANSPEPVVYDPRTGVNVTEYVPSLVPPDWDGVRRPEGTAFQTFFAFPDSSEVVGATSSKHLIVWKHNPCAARRVIRGHEDWVECLTVACGNVIYSGGADMTVRRWEVNAHLMADLYSCQEVLNTKHTGAVTSVVFNANLTNLITGADDATIRVWSTVNSALQLDMADPPKFIFRPLSNTDKKDLAREKGEQEGHSERVTGLVCVGHILVSVSWDASIRLWDILTGHLAHKIEKAHSDLILGIDYSRDTDEFATCGADKVAKVWDFDSCQNVLVFIGHTADVTQVRWNPLHKCWITGSEDGDIRTWDAQTGDLHRLIQCPSDAGGVTAMCIDPLGGNVISATQDHKIRMYNPSSGKCLKVYSGHTDSIRCLVYVGESREFLSCSWDRTIRVWNGWGHADFGTSADERERAESRQSSMSSTPGLEEVYVPYAQRHPICTPSSLEKQHVNGDEVVRKMSEAAKQETMARLARGEEVDDGQQRRTCHSRVAVKLNELEDRLKGKEQSSTSSAPLTSAKSSKARDTTGTSGNKLPKARHI
mmetsp:Transcript_34014/g.57193  ORF Transcript_34014/g.57193 Transcript_34014/m.57193 type:complete len:788 (+) Transcript_34014:49-2412(+)|eukprot:CAMPEP_0184369612 /NCGR_PEP_ID=MMETSP1089-20130417/162347_1 /TAXON_ID=38269 ORGANISM="Gloeochaete wittrockiana, Strain SAG46.84" /NCGR_SAMPLE_ID=MMETSP1089 /ASSEMBLY_ACC=CAM_ASM_000445 /LENGTH=787 /DNA_ID=CAMNT_0026712085 /DNA_START=45 /DNA_END=2408 /DNA_ORIENTATION=+